MPWPAVARPAFASRAATPCAITASAIASLSAAWVAHTRVRGPRGPGGRGRPVEPVTMATPTAALLIL